MDLSTLKEQVARAQGRQESSTARLTAVQLEISDLEDEETLVDLVTELFRKLLDKEISNAVSHLETLLTEGLQSVFTDKDLSVRAELEVQRGKVSVNLKTLEKAGGFVAEGSAMDSFGGSAVTVQAVLMRIIIIFLQGLRPFLLLDEALPAFDPDYVVNMGKFLSMLCERLGMDILMVTHNPALIEVADKAYRIEKRGGEAKFIPVQLNRPSRG